MRDRETINYYRARAPEYEQIYYRDVPERRGEIDEESKRLQELAMGRDVLDLACGTGYWTQILSQTARSVTAVDISIEMLQQARKKIYHAPIEFLQGDLNKPLFQAACFDLVTLGFWFSHQPKQEYGRFFKNISQPLKDGGPIWLIDNNPPAEGPRLESVRIDQHGNNFKRRYLGNGEKYVILKNYFSEGQLRAIFAPHFTIRRLLYKRYYWSILLAEKR